MPAKIDSATLVRPGEELPIAALEGYLQKRLPGPIGPLSAMFTHALSGILTYLLLDGQEPRSAARAVPQPGEDGR